MSLNITQLRNLVTDISCVDIPDDISQDLVDAFIREGYQRIVTLWTRWPWFQASYTLDTVVSQRGYSTGFDRDLPSAVAGLSFSDIRELISVTNETNGGNQLIYIDNFLAEKYWNGTADTPGIPTYYSLWAGQLQLWPKPDSVYSLNIRGFRQPSYAWLTDPGQNVDLNDEFHIILLNFVVARIYQYQEDPEMAALFMQHFDVGVSIARSNLTAPNSNQPIVLSGGLQTTGYYGTWPALRSENIVWWA